MHVCGNNYTAPHQSVTSSAIITKYPKNNTIIAVLNLHTFRHNKMGSQYWCSHQSHVYKCNTVHLVLPCMICMTELFTGLSMLCGPPPQVLDLKKQGPHFAAYTHNPLSHAALSVYISGTSAQQFDAYYETAHAPFIAT